MLTMWIELGTECRMGGSSTAIKYSHFQIVDPPTQREQVLCQPQPIPIKLTELTLEAKGTSLQLLRLMERALLSLE